MNPDINPNKKLSLRLVWFAGAVLVIWLGYSLWVSRLKSVVEIQVAPASSTVTLNGKNVKPGKYRVSPGNYKVAVSKPGFGSQTQNVNVAKGQKGYVGLALVPNSDTTADWYQTHPADAKISEGISSRNFDVQSDQTAQELPIIKYLPFIAPDNSFRIDYGNDNTGQAILYISYANASAKKDALDWIHYGGYDISKFKVVYKVRSASDF